MREFDLRKPVCLWLDSLGYTPLLECWSCNQCDIVGVKFGDKVLTDVVCVELKLRDVAGVVRQLDSHVFRSRLTYAAFPAAIAGRVADGHFRATSHGLLSVDSVDVVILKESSEHDGWRPTMTYRNAVRRRGQWRERLKNAGMLRDGPTAAVGVEMHEQEAAK